MCKLQEINTILSRFIFFHVFHVWKYKKYIIKYIKVNVANNNWYIFIHVFKIQFLLFYLYCMHKLFLKLEQIPHSIIDGIDPLWKKNIRKIILGTFQNDFQWWLKKKLNFSMTFGKDLKIHCLFQALLTKIIAKNKAAFFTLWYNAWHNCVFFVLSNFP